MRTTILCVMLFVLTVFAPGARAADPAELAGTWIGGIDTPRGQMEIGLKLTIEDGRLIGTLQTAHGEWDVTDAVRNDGVWTVSFRSPDGPGQLSGRVKADRFIGDWASPLAKGTFELTRSRKKT